MSGVVSLSAIPESTMLWARHRDMMSRAAGARRYNVFSAGGTDVEGRAGIVEK